MFNFFNMMGNYEDRKVDRFYNEDMTIDTAQVSDGRQPYETGIKHFRYNDNRWVIVESYDTKEEAQEGHNKWVEFMTSGSLPEYLRDCCNSEIAQFGDVVCGEDFSIFPLQAE